MSNKDGTYNMSSWTERPHAEQLDWLRGCGFNIDKVTPYCPGAGPTLVVGGVRVASYHSRKAAMEAAVLLKERWPGPTQRPLHQKAALDCQQSEEGAAPILTL